MPPIHILMKPSSSLCNLRCKYCFYEDVSNNRSFKSYGLMTPETQENVMKQIFAYAQDECTIAYQGGEPTLVGLDYFKRSIELQKKYNTKSITVHNAIQTNGYDLNEEWAKFFKENNFLVGLSLDGNKHTHNANRINEKREGTFFNIMDTVNLFNKFGVEFNILTVVNSVTAKKAAKIYEFYRKNKLDYMQFIACLDPIGEAPGQRPFSLLPADYTVFLKEIFDLWYQDIISGRQVYIRQFENYIGILLGYPPESCDLGGVCSYQNVIESDGSVYPCDFYVLDELNLGNLNTCTFDAIQQKRKETGFIDYSANDHNHCRDCKYYALCRGGCRRHRLLEREDGDFDNYYCQTYKDFFDYSLDRMMSIAKRIGQ